jgi:8-oxo-dGTP diphosphatase
MACAAGLSMAEGADPSEVRAAGAVLWRPGPEVALVHRPRYDDWSFPKGKALPGEHVLLTAVREVAEETGILVELGRRLPASHYQASGKPKRVDYWAARPAAGPQPGFKPGDETDRLDWLPVADARGRLSYDRDVRLLDDFTAGPADTVPLILLRHARARGKKAWRAAGNADDRPRPLDPAGQAQADALTELLRCFAARQVISAPAERCVATVRSFAALAGSPIRIEPVFAIAGTGEPAPPPDNVRQCVGSVVDSGLPAVVCAHRENLPVMLEAACARLGAPVPAGPPLEAGAFWVLQAGAGRLVSAEQHEPPARLSAGPVQGGRQRSLERQQPPLDLDTGAAAVAAEPVPGDHSVAGHDHRAGVRAHDPSHRARRRHPAVPGQGGHLGQLAVGDRLAVADLLVQ